MEPPGSVHLVEAHPRDAPELVAAVQALAQHTGETSEWHLLHAEPRWEWSLTGFMARPPTGPYTRRVTGGPAWPPPGEATVYAALLAPRTGPRPPSLASVYKLAEGLLERAGCRVLPGLVGECGPGRLYASAGKLAQRALVELYGPRGLVALALDGIRVTGESVLEPDMIPPEALARSRSREWNWGPLEGATHTFEAGTGAGYRLGLEVRLEPPLIAEARLYTDAFIYPPAQALLLAGQLEGVPPSRPLIVELVNSWAVLVETVGFELEELLHFLERAFEVLERDARL